MRIERVVEIEHPGVDVDKGAGCGAGWGHTHCASMLPVVRATGSMPSPCEAGRGWAERSEVRVRGIILIQLATRFNDGKSLPAHQSSKQDDASIAPHPPRAYGARHPLPADAGRGSGACLTPSARSHHGTPASPHHQCSRTVVGEELEQHGVRHTAVENDNALDPRVERVKAGLELGDHAARDDAVGD